MAVSRWGVMVCNALAIMICMIGVASIRAARSGSQAVAQSKVEQMLFTQSQADYFVDEYMGSCEWLMYSTLAIFGASALVGAGAALSMRRVVITWRRLIYGAIAGTALFAPQLSTDIGRRLAFFFLPLYVLASVLVTPGVVAVREISAGK